MLAIFILLGTPTVTTIASNSPIVTGFGGS